jgi:hypothetical protein
MALFRARQRHIFASITLGCWLFAVFIGVVHACGFDGELGYWPEGMTAATMGPGQSDDDTAPGCAQFCAGSLPVLAKIQQVADQSSEQALLLPPWFVAPLPAPVTPAPLALHRLDSPPGIALLNTRFVRLAL